MPNVIPKTLKEIANAVGGEVNGNSDLVINSLANSPEVSCENDLVFIYDKKYLKNFLKIKAKAFILPCAVKNSIPVETCHGMSLPIIWVERPRLVLKKLLELFQTKKNYPSEGIHPSAVVDSTSKIAKTCKIGANVFIGLNTIIGGNTIICPNVYIGTNVNIGNNCLVYPNVSILDNSIIGSNVILHSGVVIGSDGYSYVTEEESNLEKAKRGDFNFNLGRQIQHKIPTIGNVIIEDDVEIGTNSCVDVGTVGPTIIGTGTKIDNLVQIAHNCKIGKDCLIVGQVGFAGSVNVGDRVVVGGQSGFADNIDIGDDVIFVAKAGVHGDIPSSSVYMGMPAVPYKDYFKNEREMKRLPRKIKELEEKIKMLEEKLKVGV